jgi:hypothetical protein
MKLPFRIASLALFNPVRTFFCGDCAEDYAKHGFSGCQPTNAELELLYEQDLAKLPTKMNVIETVKRTPDHVIQRAQTALSKIRTLRLINGVTAKTIPPTPVSKVKPSDVKAIVNPPKTDPAQEVTCR